MKVRFAHQLRALVVMVTITIVACGTDLYVDMEKIHGLLRTADDRLVQLSTKSCQTGSGFVEFCPFFGNFTFTETVACFLSSLKDGPVSKEVEIFFDSPFVTKPVVSVSNSGLTWTFGSSFRISILKVTRTSITVQVTAHIPPSRVHFVYYACDQEVLFPKAYLDIQEEIAFYNES